MTGRGWLRNRVAQKNANDNEEQSDLPNNVAKAPIPVINGIHHSQTNNIAKSPIPVLHNGIHVQKCGDTASDFVVSNGIHVQEKDTKTPVSNMSNGIHMQENSIKIPVSIVSNGIHKQEKSISKAPVLNLTNVIQSQVVRGRRLISNNNMAQQSELDVIETGISSLELEYSETMSRPFPRTKMCGTGVPKVPVSTTQPQSHSLVSPQNQPIEIQSEEEPHVEYRVPSKQNNDRYVMKPLSSNYMKIEVDKHKGVYEYCVNFNPEIDVKSAKFYLINQLKELFPIKIFCGDTLYVPIMLPEKITVLKAKLKDESEVTVKITFIKKMTVKGSIQFYNNVVHSIMKTMGLVQFGKNFFDPNKKISLINEGVEIWPGFVTTIDEFDSGLLMCCDISHRVLRLHTVLDLMLNVAKKSAQTGNVREALMTNLCGVIVVTQYNNRTYRIDDIDFSSNPTSVFEKNGKKISYIDYYRIMYDLQINDLQQPMLISKRKKVDFTNKEQQDSVIYLIPELCNFTGLSEDMKSNFKLMKTIHSYTIVTPNDRQKALVDFVKSIYAHEDCKKKIENWGLKFLLTPVQLEAPVYKREAIKLGNNKQYPVGINMDWGQNVMNNAMLSSVKLMNWALIYKGSDGSTAHSFCRQLSNIGQQMGMIINSPNNIQINDGHVSCFVNAINNAIQNHRGLQLVVIIFPNLRTDLYNAAKKICCAQAGIPSQVIISKTISRPDKLKSITQKIALQINCKLGGAGWAVNIPLKDTMIIGIDVYHEKSHNLLSVLGFVASINPNFTRWYSSAIIHKSTHQEISDNLYVAIIKALDKFKEFNNGVLPDKIIVYRDGVSSGYLKIVEEKELNSLKNTLNSYSVHYHPAITFITVQKRINTKIYQFLDNLYSNPSPGTIIDTTVTKKNVFDFFLVSQNVRQGTVNPTHYIVLRNDCNLSVEHVQLLSYKLCHLYYNWCGTIKVPAPIQYAHKLAYLIGQNVGQLPNENLCDTLFYL